MCVCVCVCVLLHIHTVAYPAKMPGGADIKPGV